jgi:hypothetical protein
MLPPGEEAVSIEFDLEEEVFLDSSYELPPRQHVRPVSMPNSCGNERDRRFYRSQGPYPARRPAHVTTHFMNGYGFALAVFTPVRYYPSSGRISYFRKVTVRILSAPGARAEAALLNLRTDPGTISRIKHMAVNGEMADEYPEMTSREINGYHQFLVITGDSYTGEFDSLASFYLRRGIWTRIVSTGEISSGTTGADLQEKIRNYIIGHYQDHGVQHVLLGGDVEIVPYRGFYCKVISSSIYEDANIPSDLYYAALDGNWNDDGDTYWAEPGEDDLYPELGVARMPFSDTAQLHNMLHKTMMYQQFPVEGELAHPLLAGEHLWSNPETWGEDYMRLLIGNCDENGYDTQGIPETDPIDSLFDSHGTWSKATLISHINQGRPLVNHCGHANASYVMKLGTADITNANFSQVNGTTHNYPIIYTHGCICGGFDYADCIAERMVSIDNFAVAFIGNSRYGWFVEGTTDGPSQHINREFLDAVYRDSLYHLGEAQSRSKAETAPWVDLPGEYEPGATRWCFYDCNALGDPLMAVWTTEPHEVVADYQPILPTGTTMLNLEISSDGFPQKGFTCALFWADTLLATGVSDASGNAILTLPADLGQGRASLIISGYNILPCGFTVALGDVWLGLNMNWNNPANWASGTVPGLSTDVFIPSNPVGGSFPKKNPSGIRLCRSIYFEPGAEAFLNPGESFTIGGD